MSALSGMLYIPNSSEEDRIYTGWKDIQKSTFTNWANSVLACHQIVICDLYTDLCDGTILVKLYESISGRKIDKQILKPRVLSHKLENISLVMKAMSLDGIKFVNLGKSNFHSLDPLDICNGNSKLILALIWHMILFYQIGFIPPPRSDPSKTEISKTPSEQISTPVEAHIHTITPKSIVLKLINALLPQMRATNLTTDWNSGKTLAALVETLSPGSCPSYETWNERNSLLNVTTALCLAEVHLGVPVLIEPHHLTSKHVDELSVITYLSSFFKDGGVAEKYFLNNLLKTFPSLHVSNMTTDWNNGVALCQLVKACHPDAFPGGYFSEERINSVLPDQKVSLRISNVRSALYEAERLLNITPSIDPELFVTPNVPALVVMGYVSEFMCRFAAKVPSEPFTFSKDIKLILLSKSYITTEEIIEIKISSPANLIEKYLNIKVASECGIDIKYEYEKVSDLERKIKFTPIFAANYHVNVDYKDEPIGGSPLKITVNNHLDMKDIFIEQLDKDTYFTGESIEFIISSTKPADGIKCYLEETITKTRIHCNSARLSDKCLKNSTCLSKPGNYHLVVQTIHADLERELLRKPLTCLPDFDQVISVSQKSFIVLTGEKINFQVNTKLAGPGKLEVKLLPQNESLLEKKYGSVSMSQCHGIWDVTIVITSSQTFYWKAECYWNDKILSNATVLIHTFSLDNVYLTGNGINSAVQINTRQFLKVHISDCGKIFKVTGSLQRKAQNGQVIENVIIDFYSKGKQNYDGEYCLSNVGTYFLKILVNDKEVNKICKIEALDLKSLEFEVLSSTGNVGDKIDVKVLVPVSAGKGDLFYAMEGPDGPMKVYVDPVHCDEYVEEYLLSALPKISGEYKLILQFGGLDILGFPKSFIIDNRILNEIKHVRIEFGLIRAAILNSENHFSILYTTQADLPEPRAYYCQGEGQNQLQHMISICVCESEKCSKVYRASYKVWKKENIVIRVFIGSNELMGSPFTFPVIDPSTIQVDFEDQSGNDLICNQTYPVSLFIPYEFYQPFSHGPMVSNIDLKECLNASIIPPSGRIIFPEIMEITCDYNVLKKWANKKGKIFQLELNPIDEGKYILHFSFLTHPISGFPKAIFSKKEPIKPSLEGIKITLPSQELKIGELSTIFVDGREVGPGWLDVTLLDPDKMQISVEILPIHCKRESFSGLSILIKVAGHDMYQVNFNLEKPGEYMITMFWNKQSIPNGSFYFSAVPSLPEPSYSGGLISEGFVGEVINVTIDDAENFVDILNCRCVDSKNIPIKVVIEPTQKIDGCCILKIKPSNAGMHRVDVDIKGEPINGSPIFFNVTYPINSKKVKIYGPGIISGIIDRDKGKIYVQTDQAGGGLLQVAIQGPKNGFKLSLNESKLQESNPSPVATVDYQPQIAGLYKVNILWSGEHVPGSPFQVYNCFDQNDLQELTQGRIPASYCQDSTTNLQQTFTC